MFYCFYGRSLGFSVFVYELCIFHIKICNFSFFEALVCFYVQMQTFSKWREQQYF